MVRERAQATKLPDGRRVIDQEWVRLHLARMHAKAEFLKLVNWKIAWRIDACRDLAGLTSTILADHATPARLAEVEATDRFDRALWTDLARVGVLSVALPESVGGSGLGLLEQCAVLVELGRGRTGAVPVLDRPDGVGDRGVRHRRAAGRVGGPGGG